MRRFFRIASLAVLATACMTYAGIAGYMAANQRQMIFRADPTPPSLTAHNLPRAKDISLTVADGTKLSGWQIEPSRPNAAVYVYFPGNARTRGARATRFQYLTEKGEGLIAFDHRGYGGSEGVPGEEAAHSDARAIYAYAQRTFPGRDLIIFGESLGSGIATRLASEVSPSAVILDSAFLSMADIASGRYPWLPVRLLLQHPFRSDLVVDRVKAPVLMLHGGRDTVVPPASGRQLFELITAPKEFKFYPNAYHVGVFSHGALEDIRAFLGEKVGLAKR